MTWCCALGLLDVDGKPRRRETADSRRPTASLQTGRDWRGRRLGPNGLLWAVSMPFGGARGQDSKHVPTVGGGLAVESWSSGAAQVTRTKRC